MCRSLAPALISAGSGACFGASAILLLGLVLFSCFFLFFFFFFVHLYVRDPVLPFCRRILLEEMILSSHLPAAQGDMTERLLASLTAAPKAQPFVGPDQAALEQMLKEMTDGPQS